MTPDPWEYDLGGFGNAEWYDEEDDPITEDDTYERKCDK